MAEYQAGMDAVLETCLRAIETQGWTVNDCLGHFASYRAELAPLLTTAEQLRTTQHIMPSLAFRERAVPRLRARLQQSARPGRKAPAARRTPWLAELFFAQRRFAIGFIALAIVLGLAATTTGTIYAAGNSLPGDTLYPVEQTVERVQLAITPPGKAVGLRMDLAEKRLDEAERLRQKGDTGHIQEALDGYNALVDDAAQLIDSDANADNPALLDMVNTRLTVQQSRLEALLDKVPPAAQKGISTAIAASKRGQEKAAQAKKDHGGGKPANTPGNKGQGNSSGGGSPDATQTPASEDANPSAGNGNGAPTCSNGTDLPGNMVGQLHQLANKHKVAYGTVQDMACSGMTIEQIEAQLAGAAPGGSDDKGNNGSGKGNGKGNGNGGGNDNGNGKP